MFILKDLIDQIIKKLYNFKHQIQSLSFIDIFIFFNLMGNAEGNRIFPTQKFRDTGRDSKKISGRDETGQIYFFVSGQDMTILSQDVSRS